jgi:hypothetical protein
MSRFNNVKKYVGMLTKQIVKHKDIILKLIKMAPKKKVQAEINLEELNLDDDDPLLIAAEQLSEPDTPKVSERFKLQQNIKKEARQQQKQRDFEKLQDYQEKYKFNELVKPEEEKVEDPSLIIHKTKVLEPDR